MTIYKLFSSALLLTALSGTLTACGDEEDSRLSNDDVMCLKIIRNGGTCGSSAGTSTATETITSTTTTTDTSTVTVTSTTTSS